MRLIQKWRDMLAGGTMFPAELAGMAFFVGLWLWCEGHDRFGPVHLAIGTATIRLGEIRKWVQRFPIGNKTSKQNETTEQYVEREPQRNREHFLNRVKTEWIDGVLKHSIHSEVVKRVSHYQPELVEQRPWQLRLLEAGNETVPVPPDQPLAEIFQRSGHSLLILGEPGSGKTFTLAQLAEELFERAQRDVTEPMPIVLNLSTWAVKQGAVADWLVEEAEPTYGISAPLTRHWIAEGRLIYLLDGLDELSEEVRADCVAAIDAFRETYPVQMVVCSRSQEYRQLDTRLPITTAVETQPLDTEWIDAYLSQPDLELQAVRETLKEDTDLQKLMTTPLMLNVTAIAYQGMTRVELGTLADESTRRKHVFDHYVKRMFVQQEAAMPEGYTEAEARRWLSKLAAGMHKHKQSVFHIERLQPSWLPSNHSSRIYRVGVGLVVRLVFTLVYGLVAGLGAGMVFGLISGAVAGLNSLLKQGDIQQRMRPRPHPKIPNSLGKAVGVGVFFGLIAGLVAGLVAGLNSLLKQGDIQPRIRPNQGMRNSLGNAIRVGLIYGLVFGVVFGLIGGLVGGLGYGLIAGLGVGLVAGLVVGGGRAIIHHYILRMVLTQAGVLPKGGWQDKKLVAFLDAMQERMLLRRIGGGWMFMHRLLQDYFAEQVEEMGNR